MWNRSDKRMILLSLTLCGMFVVVAIFPRFLSVVKSRSPILFPISDQDKALLTAAEASDFAGVKRAVANGADVNVRDPKWFNHCLGTSQPRRTALIYAAAPRVKRNYRSYAPLPPKIEIVRFLLEHGADPNIASRGGDTPLSVAACKDNTAVVAELLKYDADPNVVSGFYETPFLRACACERLRIAQLLLAKGADINHRDQLGFTALHRAIERYHATTALWLLRAGADPEVRNNFRQTASDVAREKNWSETWLQLVAAAKRTPTSASVATPKTAASKTRASSPVSSS